MFFRILGAKLNVLIKKGVGILGVYQDPLRSVAALPTLVPLEEGQCFLVCFDNVRVMYYARKGRRGVFFFAKGLCM